MENSAFQKGTTLQLFPMIVGPTLATIHSSYVVINRRPILLESPLRAVEVAFKIFHALNCSYPIQSQRMWVVLSVALFNIHEESTTQIMTLPDVIRLVEILKV